MAELADAPDLGSGGLPVQVQVLSSALKENPGTSEMKVSGIFLFFYAKKWYNSFRTLCFG